MDQRRRECDDYESSPMEWIKITDTMAYLVKAVTNNKAFMEWQKHCKIELGSKISLGLIGDQRIAMRNRIFATLKRAQQKNIDDGAVKGERVLMEVQIPSDKNGLVIGTDGATIKEIKAETGVPILYIEDGTRKSKVNRAARPGFSWLVIGANRVENVVAAWAKAEQKLSEAVNDDLVDGEDEDKSRTFREHLLVPKQCVVEVIGNRGETIEKLKKQFGVRMAFLGENCLDYPEGRTLSIVGDSADAVQRARDFVDNKYILAHIQEANQIMFDNNEDSGSSRRRNGAGPSSSSSSSSSSSAVECQQQQQQQEHGSVEEEEAQQANHYCRMRVPAAEYFSDEQWECFDQIKAKYNRLVEFAKEESDPGERTRCIRLSAGAGNKVHFLRAQSELRALVAEVGGAEAEETMLKAAQQRKAEARDDEGSDNPPAVIVPAKAATCRVNFTKHLLVPKQCVMEVIGYRGETIEKLKKQFGVRMAFLGENCLDYPEGRTLSIVGDSSDAVQRARDFVDNKYILTKWDMLNTQQLELELAADCQEVFLLSPQFSKREDLEGIMLKMKEESGIVAYTYRSPRDGHRPVVLQGSEQAVERAVKMVRKMQADWTPQPQPINNCNRVRSLDEISITSFAKLAEHEAEEQTRMNGGMKEENDQGDLNEEAIDQEEEMAEEEDDDDAEQCGGVEAVQQKLRETQAMVARLCCIECHTSERSILFTPCRHLLFCKQCSELVQCCPICEQQGGKKLVVYLQ